MMSRSVVQVSRLELVVLRRAHALLLLAVVTLCCGNCALLEACSAQSHLFPYIGRFAGVLLTLRGKTQLCGSMVYGSRPPPLLGLHRLRLSFPPRVPTWRCRGGSYVARGHLQHGRYCKRHRVQTRCASLRDPLPVAGDITALGDVWRWRTRQLERSGAILSGRSNRGEPLRGSRGRCGLTLKPM